MGDEVGTPDSSRIWDGPKYRDESKVVENSKEFFRQMLLKHFPDPDILTNKNRMDERKELAAENLLPEAKLMEVSKVYTDIAEKITGEKIKLPRTPRRTSSLSWMKSMVSSTRESSAKWKEHELTPVFFKHLVSLFGCVAQC